jgi:demethylmenaquinone methyltransferase/2-methoxy-6-polyprenyl-1,4-benzoquinol methylase
MLDVGAGTGEIALDAWRENPALKVVALDLTLNMMRVGREKSSGRRICWVNADALTLPFADETFDIVTSGYLMRNVPDVSRAFREQLRVVRRGGRVACLDTCPPKDNVLKPLISLYFRLGIPVLGGIVSGQWAAYRYLPATMPSSHRPSWQRS